MLPSAIGGLWRGCSGPAPAISHSAHRLSTAFDRISSSSIPAVGSVPGCHAATPSGEQRHGGAPARQVEADTIVNTLSKGGVQSCNRIAEGEARAAPRIDTHRASWRSHMRTRYPDRWTTKRFVLPAALAVALTIVPGSAASARLGSFQDAEDAKTRLDLADVSLRFHPETRHFKWRFTTFERFRLRNGGSFLLFVNSLARDAGTTGSTWDDAESEAIYCDGKHRAGAGGGRRFGPTSSQSSRPPGSVGSKASAGTSGSDGR